MWTSSDRASNQGLRSTPRSGEGKFSVLALQNALCAHLTSLHLLCPNSDETEKTNFAVIPGQLYCCSSLYPGIWHQDDILLWNVFFVPSCIIEHVLFNQLMQSFKSWFLKLIVNFLKVFEICPNEILSLKLPVGKFMLSHSNWAGLDDKNTYFCIKVTVDKTFLVNLNLSKIVSVKFCEFEIKLKFIGYVFCNYFLLFICGPVFPDVERISSHCDTVWCGLHWRACSLKAF